MKIFYTLGLCLCFYFQVSAQNGLEKIIVEKYYVSNENDTAVDGDGGELPVNSVTYRVFVDMLPGYIFQAAFGVPEHELKIATTTRFFNNEDRGAKFPTYSRSQAQNNTVMLDSWLSVGGALRDYAGVLKSHDNGTNTIVNADGVLQNDDTRAGIPLTVEDGAIEAVTEPVTVVGFFDTDVSIFEDSNTAPIPSVFSSRDGAWSSLNGSTGPDADENIVLIGQFTTDGVFEFELNLQIRNQQTLGVETYVARNATENEILFDQLIHIDSLDLVSATHEDLVYLNNQISVYPNPTDGHVNIGITKQMSLTSAHNHYEIKSMDGSTLLTGAITGHLTSVELGDLLPPGIYLLSLQLEDRYHAVKKLVVTH